MHAESRTVDRVNQIEIGHRTIGMLQPIISIVNFVRFGFTESMNRAAVFNRRIEKFLGKIFRVGTIPDIWIVSARDIDAAARAHGVRQCAALDDVVEILLRFPASGSSMFFQAPTSEITTSRVAKRVLDRAYGPFRQLSPAGNTRRCNQGVGARGQVRRDHLT